MTLAVVGWPGGRLRPWRPQRRPACTSTRRLDAAGALAGTALHGRCAGRRRRCGVPAGNGADPALHRPGPCPNGLEPLLKTVGAVAGDVVTLPLPGYAPLAADAAGRPLTAYPAGTYRVQPGQVFLFSKHDLRSFDSRYFGPVETRSIIAAGKPVWTPQ